MNPSKERSEGKQKQHKKQSNPIHTSNHEKQLIAMATKKKKNKKKNKNKTKQK